jgi:hypothetical protein
MILEAFSRVLQAPENRGLAPETVLSRWLASILLVPPAPDDQVARVIHTEIAMCRRSSHYVFEGQSRTGTALLESMYSYCRSYDHWQFSRWLHHTRASDFPIEIQDY